MNRKTTRQPGWQIRLDELTRAFAESQYSWGSFDCCTVVGDVVEAITGVDPISDVRGKYSTESGAYRILIRLGGMQNAWESRLGARIDPKFAQPGDVGISGDAVVFYGGGCWMGAAEYGVVQVDAPHIAWRCCHV